LVAPAAIKAVEEEARVEGTKGVLGIINIDACTVHTSEEFRSHFVFLDDPNATPAGVIFGTHQLPSKI
jgi:hypothetical protein